MFGGCGAVASNPHSRGCSQNEEAFPKQANNSKEQKQDGTTVFREPALEWYTFTWTHSACHCTALIHHGRVVDKDLCLGQTVGC
jgi:hypothetical protein